MTKIQPDFAVIAEIGAASGLYSWFMATFVRSGRVPFKIALAILAIPFLLIYLIAPNVVVLVLFALALVPICAVAIRTRQYAGREKREMGSADCFRVAESRMRL